MNAPEGFKVTVLPDNLGLEPDRTAFVCECGWTFWASAGLLDDGLLRPEFFEHDHLSPLSGDSMLDAPGAT